MIPNDITPTAELVKPAAELKEEADGRDARSTKTGKKVRRYTASAKVVAANRRNALRSRGPRTVAGKLNSRMNAVKHGILSGAVVVRGLRIQEQEGEFKMLREQCWGCLAPVGRIEEMLVDRIVAAQWRLRRVLMAETGEIVLSVDGGLRHQAERLPLPLPLGMFRSEFRDAAEQMEMSADGLDYLRAVLRMTRSEVEREGGLTQGVYEQLLQRFTDQPNLLTREFLRLRERFEESVAIFAEAAATEAPGDTSAVASEAAVVAGAVADELADEDEMSLEELKESQREMVLEIIGEKLARYEKLSAQIAEREDKEETARQAANVLPSAEVLEKILRYESALERQLYRAMNQLERLQRRRNGDKVNAPLVMEVMK